MDGILVALTFVTALGCGLSAGGFFAFSSFVMRAEGADLWNRYVPEWTAGTAGCGFEPHGAYPSGVQARLMLDGTGSVDPCHLLA